MPPRTGTKFNILFRELLHWGTLSDRENGNCPIATPADPEQETRHAYHLFTIQVNPERSGISRDAFLDALTAENIGVGVHYLPVHLHPFYRKTYGWKEGDFPNTASVN